MYQILFQLQPSQPTPLPGGERGEKRRGLVLVAVLIVVTLLSLAAYRYADFMTSEQKKSTGSVRYAQAKASAEAGIHYVCALMASEMQGATTMLAGNPYDNAQYFRGQVVSANDSPRSNAKFDIISVHYEDPLSGMSTMGSPGPYSGLTDEASKINLNACMIADPSGNTLYGMLMGLPNMTDPIANSIVYWLDPTAAERSSGADNTAYSGLGYQAKNGPINSLEELLWVQDVTPQLLYGDDINRNGVMDNGETITDATGVFGRGWSQYFTLYSREPNLSSTGATRINLNDKTVDLPTQFTNLTSAMVDTDLATFIILAELYGLTPAPSSSTSTTPAAPAPAGPGGGGGAAGKTTTGSLGSVQLSTIAPSGTMAKSKISSMYALIGASVTVTTTTTTPAANPKTPAKTTTTTTVYQSPLSDTSSIQTLFPPLYDAATTSTAPVLLGRVNINTMSQTVLEAIANASSNSAAASSGTAGTGATAGTGTTAGGGTTGAMAGGGTTGGAGNPLLSEQQIEQILASQPMFSGAQALDPSFQCPVWLITEAQIDPATMQKLEPYITTYSQVYSFQSMGYFDSGELAVRFEAVIDLNPSPNNLAGTTGAGTTPTWTPGTGLTCYPRILFQRDISELQGFSNLLPQQQ